MMSRLLDWLWHRGLNRPYLLSRTVDEGQGDLVVLLHGIGRTGQVWRRVIKLLEPLQVRVVAFDLLGFGDSPKPDWPDYDSDDHARSVIASLEKLKSGGGPAVLVGHSMGCLVAVRVARLRPDLVRHLVLYEMPLYKGLPEKWRYRLRLNLYARLYRRITLYRPAFDAETAKLTERLARRVIGFEVQPDTWQPFVKSLEHTIMNQTAADDIKQLDMPMDAIYGTYDMFVIRGRRQQIFGQDMANVTAHTIRERHTISQRASRFIVERVAAALALTNSMPSADSSSSADQSVLA